MRSMSLVEYGKPLEPREVPRPTPPAGYALVEILACGLCFSDVKTIRGHMPYSDTLGLPHVPGHEISGRVVEVNGPSRWLEGDRVVVYHLWGCHRCGSCRRGDEHLCTDVTAWAGFTHTGGFQEYIVVPVEYLLSVPEHIPATVAPALTCAMGTAYRAVLSRGHVVAGEQVVVMGLGGVGIHAALIAQAAGAQVIGVDVGEKKLAGARRAGLATAVDSADAADAVRAVAPDGADAVIESTGVPALLEASRGLLRPGGRVSALGYKVGASMGVSSHGLVLQEQSVIGSRFASRNDMEHVIRMVADGLVTPVIDEVLPLERVNEAIERLEAGTVSGRLVMSML